MPLALAGRPVAVTLTFQDRDRNKRTSTVNFPGTLTIADLAANLAAIEAAFAALSDAFIVDGTVTIDLVQTTVAAGPPPETSDVERKGSFVFKTEAGTTAKLEIPSIANTLVVDDSNVIDRNDPAVQAFIGLVLNGIPPVVGEPVTGSGISYSTFEIARKIHRGSSKG